MTSQELYSLIVSDPTALALAIAGDDAGCAARCTDIAPATLSTSPVLMGKILIAQTALDAGHPFGGGEFTTNLKAMVAENAQYSATVADMLDGLEPWAPGLDFANPGFRAQLDYFAGIQKLNADVVTALKNAAIVKPTFTAEQVSRSCQPYRQNEKVGLDNWIGVRS